MKKFWKNREFQEICGKFRGTLKTTIRYFKEILTKFTADFKKKNSFYWVLEKFWEISGKLCRKKFVSLQ